MKNRKGMVLFLVFVMLFSTMATAFADGATPNDKVNALIEAGLVKGDANGYRLGDSITRAEVVTMLVRMVGKEEEADSFKAMKSVFVDVPVGHWANGNINYAVMMGLTNGYPDGSFKPEAEISNQEVIAMLVRAAGDLTDEEKATAVWPTAYILKALKLGILADVNINAYADKAIRGIMFNMVYNTRELGPVINTFGNPVEALVVENSRVARLNDNEIRIKVLKDQYAKEDGFDEGDMLTVNLEKVYIDGDKLDSEGLLGKVLTVDFNKKGEAVRIKVNSGYKYVTGVLTDIDTDSIEVDEKSFDVSVDSKDKAERMLASALLNNKKMNFDGANGFEATANLDSFVKATIKNGYVLFVEAFEFEDIAPVVKVSKDEIIFIDNDRNGAERTLTVKEDEFVVMSFNGEFAKSDLKSLEQNDIIHWFEDKNDDVVIVVMKAKDIKTEGKMEGISFKNKNDKEPTIDFKDKEITAIIDNSTFSPVYSTVVKNSKIYELTMNYVSELEGFYDKQATAYVDIFGNLQMLIGSENSEMRMVGVITDKFYKEFEIAFGNGEVSEFNITRKTDFFKTSGSSIVSAVEGDFAKLDLVRVLVDNKDIVEIEKLTNSEATITLFTKNVIEIGSNHYYIDASTNVFALDTTDVEDSKVMTVKEFLDLADEAKTIKGYVVSDDRDGRVAEHIIITDYTKAKSEDTIETVVKVTAIRARGSNYVISVVDAKGKTSSYTVEDKAEVLKIKNNQVKVDFIIEISVDEKTKDLVEMRTLMNNVEPVFYIDQVGRGGSHNLSYVTLKDINGDVKTVWLANTSDVFGRYKEGSYVAVAMPDAYDVTMILNVIDTKVITGDWVTAEDIASGQVVDMLNALPAINDLVVGDKPAVTAVRVAYDALNAKAKSLVGQANLTLLQNYEAKIVELETPAP